MKKYSKYITLICLSVMLISSCSEKDMGFIKIRGSMLINETGYGNSMALFDEQDNTQAPVTHWETPGQIDFWPAGVIIDFGQEYQFSGLWIFDGPKTKFNGKDFEHAGGVIVINTGKPFDWKKQHTYKLVNDSAWHFIKLNSDSRFVQLQKVSNRTFTWNGTGPFQCDPEVREIIFCGFPENRKSPGNISFKPEIASDSIVSGFKSSSETSKNNTAEISMDQLIGVNCYSWSSETHTSQIGFLREYHHWKLNGVRTVSKPISWISLKHRVSFDLFFKGNAGKVCADIHRNVEEEKYGEARPDFGNDPLNPLSYELVADFMFQFAARYGKTVVQENMLRVKPGEPVISGTGWVSYLETWNEPDRWWGNPGDHFTPYQMSAMLSASYDGHLGKMGSNRGGKTADPMIKMVSGGLASLDTSYITAMKWWSDYNRNGSFPADVISFHHYCNSSGGQGFTDVTKGISPEADDFKGRMQKMVEWRNRNLPSCEIWISEFGWDSSPGTPQSATGHTQYPGIVSSHELQAIWLVRGYLAGAAAGIDRMCMFMLNDEEGEGLFKSCGLLLTNNEPKLSWYYLCTLKNTLAGTFFNREIPSGHPDVWIYKFTNKENTKDAYVLWCPTSDGTIVTNYMFSVSDTIRNAKLVQLADNTPYGKISPLRMTHNMTGVEVSETPVMIVIEK